MNQISRKRTKTKKAATSRRPVSRGATSGDEDSLKEPLPLMPPKWLIPTPSSGGAERRRRPRARASFNARLYAGDGRETYLEAKLRSIDVSLNGVFLHSTFFLPIGTSVRVEFEVPDVGEVAADGTVSRTQTQGDHTGFGIEFQRFREGSLEALISVFIADEVRQFVEEYCRKRRGEPDMPTPTSLLHGILAWEIHRSSLNSD